jgi:hypothetical protein
MNEVISELEKISENTRQKFGALSAQQINWRPSEEGWSVGQCFEHLIKTNELFYGELDKLAAGTRRNSFWENWSPFTGLGGSLLINSLKKDERKFKAPSPKIVPPSAVDEKIVEKFAAHQTELIQKIKRCESADARRIVVTSPFLKAMTYGLADGFTVIVEHEKRHFRQAERVMQAEGFPR